MKPGLIPHMLLLMTLTATALGNPVNKTNILLTQPDGNSFRANIIGDEFNRQKTTLDGSFIMQDAEGYWCYVEFDSQGRKRCSGVRVGEKGSSAAALQSKMVPLQALSERTSSKRDLYSIPGDNIVKRINSQSSATKDGNSMRKHGIVILAQFKDVQFQYTKADFQKLLTEKGYKLNGATGSAKDYFDSQFEGKWDFSFDVSEVVTVSKKRSYYGGNNPEHDDDDNAPEEMIREACILADSQIDFSLYDDDSDGQVDNVFVFFAGEDEADGGDEECIWSHAWYLYNGAKIDLTLDGKRINRYACTSELSRDREGKYHMAAIGTFCHEFSHTLGLPDLYDTDYTKSGGTSEALWGSTALMDMGNNNNSGNTPPAFNAIEREILGLSEAKELPEGKVIMTPSKDGGDIYRIDSGTDGEYYLLECRKNDSWDMSIGGNGLLVYHIDKTDRNAGRSETQSKVITASERWFKYNEINCRPDHQCADLLEANSSARTVSQVFFPSGTSSSITPTGKTSFKFWDGSISGISINNIEYNDGTVTMYVSKGDTPVPPKANVTKSEVFQDAAIITWEASEDWEGNSYISWAQSDSKKESFEVKPYSKGHYAYLIEGISPKTAYSCEVYFIKDDFIGEKTKCSFTTKSYSDDNLPYIYVEGAEKNSDGTFKKGCSLSLRVYNAIDAEGVVWYYDGQKISVVPDFHYYPSKSGILKAEVVYSDGKKLIITKQINLK